MGFPQSVPGTCSGNTMRNTGSCMFLFLFPCLLRMSPSSAFVERDSHQTLKNHPPKRKIARRVISLYDTERRETVGDDNLDVDHQQAEGQWLPGKKTWLGDGEMEKLVMCRMIRDFTVFKSEHYPKLEVANEQSEYGTKVTVIVS